MVSRIGVSAGTAPKRQPMMIWSSTSSQLMAQIGSGSPTSRNIAQVTDGFYCCAVIDTWSRKVVSWSIPEHVGRELVVDALELAR